MHLTVAVLAALTVAQGSTTGEKRNGWHHYESIVLNSLEHVLCLFMCWNILAMHSSLARGSHCPPIGMQSMQITTFLVLLRLILALIVKISPPHRHRQWEYVYFVKVKEKWVRNIDPSPSEDLFFLLVLGFLGGKTIPILSKDRFFPNFGHKTIPLVSEDRFSLVLTSKTAPPPFIANFWLRAWLRNKTVTINTNVLKNYWNNSFLSSWKTLLHLFCYKSSTNQCPRFYTSLIKKTCSLWLISLIRMGVVVKLNHSFLVFIKLTFGSIVCIYK